jgi:outer membrane protein OmpA-like peptidoglycan-associated protein
MKLGLALASFLTLAACDVRPEDFSKSRADVAAFQTTWETRIGALTSRETALMTKVQGLQQTADRDAVISQLETIKTQIDAMPAAVTAATDAAAKKIDARHQALAEDALTAADADLRSQLDTISSTLDDAATKVDALVATAAAAVDKEPQPAPTSLMSFSDPQLVYTRAVADVPGIEFSPGTAAFDFSKPTVRQALDAVVAFANTCPELRLALVGHTAKDANEDVNGPLSKAQAEAVEKYLQVSGIDAAKVTQVTGVGGTQPLVAEPDPGSPEEKAMTTDQLAAVRRQNRRISLLVLTPCPAR